MGLASFNRLRREQAKQTEEVKPEQLERQQKTIKKTAPIQSITKTNKKGVL